MISSELYILYLLLFLLTVSSPFSSQVLGDQWLYADNLPPPYKKQETAVKLRIYCC